jgi:uncharacterized protein (TIGR02118 family)
MIKLVFCLRRRPELSRAEFQRYWRDEHAPLVRSHADVLHIRRYVQVHSLPSEVQGALRASRDAPEEYDGVAELWWDSLDDLAASAASDDGRVAAATLLEDERRFIDLERSPIFLAQEHEILASAER